MFPPSSSLRRSANEICPLYLVTYAAVRTRDILPIFKQPASLQKADVVNVTFIGQFFLSEVLKRLNLRLPQPNTDGSPPVLGSDAISRKIVVLMNIINTIFVFCGSPHLESSTPLNAPLGQKLHRYLDYTYDRIGWIQLWHK